jgi:hypothetical protein
MGYDPAFNRPINAAEISECLFATMESSTAKACETHVEPITIFFSDKIRGLFDNLLRLPYKLLSLDESEGFIMRRFSIRFLAVIVAATMFCSVHQGQKD